MRNLKEFKNTGKIIKTKNKINVRSILQKNTATTNIGSMERNPTVNTTTRLP